MVILFLQINMTNPINQKDQRRGGLYWIDGKPYVSVTTVLKILDKPALQYWFGKQVWMAMIEDPTLDERSALAAPYKVRDKAADRGSTVHSVVEVYKTSKKKIDTIPEAFRGYCQAFYDWVDQNDVEIIANEKTVVSKVHGFAGTLDLMVKFNKTGKTFIIDIKTGKDIYEEATLQLSAYWDALESEADGIAVLLLMEDGKHKYQECTNQIDAFLACKKIWEWKNPSMMEMVGRYK